MAFFVVPPAPLPLREPSSHAQAFGAREQSNVTAGDREAIRQDRHAHYLGAMTSSEVGRGGVYRKEILEIAQEATATQDRGSRRGA